MYSMPVYKFRKESKFAYCNDCYLRVNRVYQRMQKTVIFKGFAWFCKECNTFTLDKDVVSVHSVGIEKVFP